MNGDAHAEFMDLVFITDHHFHYGETLLCMHKSKLKAANEGNWQGGVPTWFVLSKKQVGRADLVNLIHAAPILYQQLTYQYAVLQSVLEIFEALPGCQATVKALLDAQNAILTTQRAAIEGIDKVADEIDNEARRKDEPKL